MEENKIEVNLKDQQSVTDTLDYLLNNFDAICKVASQKSGLQYGVYKDKNFIEHSLIIHKEIPSYSELSFFLKAAENTANTDKIIDYAKRVIIQNKIKKIWFDEEMPMGVNAAFALAYTNKLQISLYVNLLRTCDMNHEVYQTFQIEVLFDKWKMCDENLELLAARSGTIAGQWGIENYDIPPLSELQQATYFKYLLTDALTTKRGRVFYDSLIDALNSLNITINESKFKKLFDARTGTPVFNSVDIPSLERVR